MNNQLAVKEESHNLIFIEQLPVITARLKELESEIENKLQQAITLVVTPDSKQVAKGLKSELNKERDVYEAIRKDIKTSILKPYDEFNAEYDRVIKSKYNAAEAELNAKIKAIESAEIEQKTAEVKGYYAEYAESVHIDFVTFNRAGVNVNLSASLKALKEQCKAFLDRISDDLALIGTQEHKTEILVEYKKTLNCSQAITAVTVRYKAIEEEQARAVSAQSVAAVEAEVIEKVEAIAPPVVCTSGAGRKTLTFKVTDTIERLRELKRFLDDGGYQYE